MSMYPVVYAHSLLCQLAQLSINIEIDAIFSSNFFFPESKVRAIK